MSLLQMVEGLRPNTHWGKEIRRFLRDEASHITQEIPHTDVLRTMAKTGPLGIDYRALLAISQRIERQTRLIYVAVGISLLALLAALIF